MSVTDTIPQRTGKYIGIALLALFAFMLGESFRRTYVKIQRAQETALGQQAEWQVEGVNNWLDTQFQHLDELATVILLLDSGSTADPRSEDSGQIATGTHSPPEITSHLQLSLDRLPQFDWLAVADANGDIQSLVWQGEEAFPINPPRVPLLAQSYFQQAMRGIPGAAYQSTVVSEGDDGSISRGSSPTERPSPHGTGTATLRLSSSVPEAQFLTTDTGSSARSPNPQRDSHIIVAVPLWSWPPLRRETVQSPRQLDIRQQSLETLGIADMAAPAQAPFPVGVILGEIPTDVLLAEVARNRADPTVQLTVFDAFGRSLYSDWEMAGLLTRNRRSSQPGEEAQLRFKDLNLVDGQRLVSENAVGDGPPSATYDNRTAVRPIVVEGTRLYATARPIPQLGGHVVLSSTPSQFEEPLYPLRAMGLGGLILGGGGILLGVQTMRSLDRNQRQWQELEQLRKTQADEHEQLSQLQRSTIETISYQMAAPLSSLKQGLSLFHEFRKTADESQQLKYLHLMQRATDRLGTILDRIVSLREMDAHPLRLWVAPVDLTRFCADIVDNCNQRGNPQVELSFLGTCGTVYLDSHLLEITLEPLLMNAQKYSTSHPELPPVQLCVDCRQSGVLSFTVIDSGIGIPDVDMGAIAEPFVRGSNVSRTEGLGVGLALAKRALSLQRGKWTIESQQGQGTKWMVEIPLGKPEQVSGHHDKVSEAVKRH